MAKPYFKDVYKTNLRNLNISLLDFKKYWSGEDLNRQVDSVIKDIFGLISVKELTDQDRLLNSLAVKLKELKDELKSLRKQEISLESNAIIEELCSFLWGCRLINKVLKDIKKYKKLEV